MHSSHCVLQPLVKVYALEHFKGLERFIGNHVPLPSVAEFIELFSATFYLRIMYHPLGIFNRLLLPDMTLRGKPNLMQAPADTQEDWEAVGVCSLIFSSHTPSQAGQKAQHSQPGAQPLNPLEGSLL